MSKPPEFLIIYQHAMIIIYFTISIYIKTDKIKTQKEQRSNDRLICPLSLLF